LDHDELPVRGLNFPSFQLPPPPAETTAP
jgi:hypothetical protein